MPTCKLCYSEQVLCNSHIIPEFLWTKLYDSNHKLIGITGEGTKGWSKLQKGLREKLFCEGCEQYFNEYFEKPFYKIWVENSLLPEIWEKEKVHCLNVDYSSFKLFHLSVFYRAHISKLQIFTQIELGSHAEIIRKMILSREAGAACSYPIVGYAVINSQTNRPVHMISCGQTSAFDDLKAYGLMYGGVEWWMGLAQDNKNEFQKICLNENGDMPIAPIPWNEVGAVAEASKALQKTK